MRCNAPWAELICFLVQGPFVAAGDIRRRLSESLSAPQALFRRDPEDPSGRFEQRNYTNVT